LLTELALMALELFGGTGLAGGLRNVGEGVVRSTGWGGFCSVAVLGILDLLPIGQRS